MRLSDSDADRVLAGQVPDDRADLEQVASFLAELPTACPPAEVGSVRDEHLYTIAREARIVAATPAPRPRRSTRRVLITAMAASLGVLTMGVSVAAAVGANPLSFLPNLLPEPAISARVDTPASVGPTGTPVPPPPTSRPETAAPTSRPGTPAPQSTEKSNNGKSDEAKSEHKPTAKPSHTNNGKSDEAKSDHKPTTKATPPKATPSTGPRTDPPGKSTSGS